MAVTEWHFFNNYSQLWPSRNRPWPPAALSATTETALCIYARQRCASCYSGSNNSLVHRTPSPRYLVSNHWRIACNAGCCETRYFLDNISAVEALTYHESDDCRNRIVQAIIGLANLRGPLLQYLRLILECLPSRRPLFSPKLRIDRSLQLC